MAEELGIVPLTPPTLSEELRNHTLSFAEGLAVSAGAKETDPIVYLKHEGELNPCRSFPTRADFIAGTNATDNGWITVAAARQLARKQRAVLITF